VFGSLKQPSSDDEEVGSKEGVGCSADRGVKVASEASGALFEGGAPVSSPNKL